MQRRLFLKGAGAIVGLPFLESFLPNTASAQDASPNSFAIFVRHPHGVVHDKWWPTKLGALSKDTMPGDFACGKMQEHMAIASYVRGLKMSFPNRNCHHNIHGLQLFTASEPRYSEKQGDALATSESMEWLIAEQFHPTVDPLVLFAGNRESFLNDTTSFRKDGSKVLGENDPLKVYNRIFGTQKEDTTALLRGSVNDFIREQINGLKKNPRLSTSDKKRLDQHFETIRDTEIKIAKTLPEDKVKRLNEIGKDSNALKNANRDRLDEVIKLHMDIIALAISSGYVRGVNFQMMSGIDNTRFTFDGKQLPPTHACSHHEGVSDREENIRYLRRFDVFWQEAIAYLATQLSKDKVNGKPMMDYGVIMATTEISEGTSHQENNIPHLLVGSANGRLKTGEYFDFGEISNANMLSTIGYAIGLKNKGTNDPMTDFGSPKSRTKGRIAKFLKA